MLRLFWEVSRLALRRQFTYRTANYAGLATNLFFGFLRAALMTALYGAQGVVAGISLTQAITYTALTQSLIAVLSLFGWYELMQTVYSGEVGADLLKPMPYYIFWMAQDFGRALANLLVRGVPLILLYALVFHISLPAHAWQWGVLLLSLLLAWMVSFSWRFLTNLAAFWTPNAVGFGRFVYGISWLLCGFIMPLRFFPEWMQRVAALTPFPSMINTSIEVYWGVASPLEIAGLLAAQLGWFAALTAAGQIALRAGVRKLVIQGG